MSDDENVENVEEEIASYETWMDEYKDNVLKKRNLDDNFPDTVKILTKPCGSKVYLIGTAHFSEQSCREVEEVIEKTKPDFVMLELCKMRSMVLHLDESKLNEQCKNGDLIKMIKKDGLSSGVMHYLLLRLSDHVMKEIKMLPGAEFRAAYLKARESEYTNIILGDRAIDVTLKRTFTSLGIWGRLKLIVCLLSAMKPITKEDIERMKNSDILEELLKEMGQEFPQLCQVLVSERDQYLAKSIWDISQPFPTKAEFMPNMEGEGVPQEKMGSITVAVVGIGHVNGILKHWSSAESIDKSKLVIIEPPPITWRIFSNSVKVGFVLSIVWISYKFGCCIYNLF